MIDGEVSNLKPVLSGAPLGSVLGHDFTLVKGQIRLDFTKCSFFQRPVNEWIKLLADCVHSSSINMFKNRIDNYLVRTGYT